MKARGLLIPVVLSALTLCGQAWPSSLWLGLSSDARNVVRKAAADELGKRKAAATPQEEAALWKQIEDEKGQGDDRYREHLDRARLSFLRAKQARDDLAALSGSLAADLDGSLKEIKAARTAIEDIDKSLIRWNQETGRLRQSFVTALGAVKTGPVLIAALYTADVKDTQRTLDLLADRVSAPVLVQRRAADRGSVVKALEGALPEGFSRGMPEGSFGGDSGSALSVIIAKEPRGVTYLRLKRYDFYPFQKPAGERPWTGGEPAASSAATIGSPEDLADFLKKGNRSLGAKEAKQAEILIRDAAQARMESERQLDGQIRSFRERSAGLQRNIADVRHDYETWAAALKNQQARSEPMRQALDKTRAALEAAERSFKEAAQALRARVRLQETLIPIREAVFLKGSQGPVEAAADAVADRLPAAKKEAEDQYVRDTAEAARALAEEGKTARTPGTDSRIVGVTLLSYAREGDMVRIQAAFRVRTALKEEPPPERREVLADPAVAIELVLVKGGCFQMGDAFDDGQPDEKPVHTVCVDDFYMGKYEVTQAQWLSVMGRNPSFFNKCGDKCPVEQVSWNDIQVFISKLNALSGKAYRLPTEAEWEYAARSGGKKEKYAGTSADSDLEKYAWFSANTGGRTRPAGQRQPNGLGLHDMTGNVWEWCQDWYGQTYYGQSSRKNPTGPASGTRRVLRGGAWIFEPKGIRASVRYHLTPDSRGDLYGFRLALPVPR